MLIISMKDVEKLQLKIKDLENELKSEMKEKEDLESIIKSV